MSVRDYVLASFAPAVLMAYGWFLGQQHQSMSDLAGILMFTVGAAALLLSLFIRLFLKRWRNWYASLLIGLVSCVFAFGLVVVYARVNG
jgi:hypothetical protein